MYRFTLTQKNALKICELAGRPGTKVFAGAVHPMMRHLVTAEHVHGRTGLDGPDLPAPTMQIQEKHAVDFIIETLLHEPPATVTLCALGPLTNIALALTREPRIVPRIQEIVLMGGGLFEGGNITPAAEFNIYVDPQAADIVLQIRRAGGDDAARRHTPGADDPQARRRFPQHRHARRHRGRRRCSSFSSASTRRNTAPMAGRCTIPA